MKIYYKVVTATTSGDLEQQVNDQICAGLVPVGGLCYMPLPHGAHTPFMLCQAMVQYETESQD